MPVLRYRPAAPLDRYVECFWWSERSEPQTHGEHILPSGRAQLVVALHDNHIVYRPNGSSHWVAWAGSVVHGPQWRHYVVGPKPRGTAVGVAFRPGCAGCLLGVAMSELTDRHICLDALWGDRAGQLRQRLLTAVDAPSVFQVLERYLSARIQAPLLMHPAVAYALASSAQAARVSDVQRQTGYSPRHFIAKFNESVGVTPKQYFRIQRFNRVTQRLASNQQVMLADLAASLGYSDQAHLTREFREFAGVPPSRYHAQSQSPLHHRSGRQVAPPSAGKRSTRLSVRDLGD